MEHLKEILGSVFVQHVLPYLVYIAGIAAVAILGLLINLLLKWTGLSNSAVAVNIGTAFDNAASPIISKWFNDVSRGIRIAAEDGRISKEEKQKLLHDAGESAFAEVKHFHQDLIKKLHPELKKAEALARVRIKALYEEFKKKLR